MKIGAKTIKLCLFIGLAMFIYFGRNIYKPLVYKMKGKETTESMVSKIDDHVYDRLQDDLQLAGFNKGFPKEIVLVGLKEERILQVYGVRDQQNVLIKEYPFTAFSGQLGPKLKEGDKQIPEGVYDIEYFNPNSLFYLSMKVSYPNDFDKSKSKFDDVKMMGGDIFIHGKAATVGCIPVGDTAIEELFVIAHKANQNKIKVIISPRDFRINPEYPSIDSVDWEVELYSIIEKELKAL